MGAKITRKAGSGADILKNLTKSATKLPHVNVGFFESAQYPDGTYVAQVAYWNEFGTKTSPARPFMRNAISKSKNDWGKSLGAVLKHTNGDIKLSLNAMGQSMVADVQDSIINGSYTPNSMTTNILKQRFPKGGYTFDDFLKAHKDAQNGETAPEGKTLDWSGAMLQSVTSEVEDA